MFNGTFCLHDKIRPPKPIPIRRHPSFLAYFPLSIVMNPILYDFELFTRLSTCQVFLCFLHFPSTYPSTSSSNFIFSGEAFLTHKSISGCSLLSILFCMYVCSHVSFSFNTHYPRLFAATGQCPCFCIPPGLDSD